MLVVATRSRLCLPCKLTKNTQAISSAILEQAGCWLWVALKPIRPTSLRQFRPTGFCDAPC